MQRVNRFLFLFFSIFEMAALESSKFRVEYLKLALSDFDAVWTVSLQFSSCMRYETSRSSLFNGSLMGPSPRPACSFVRAL